MTARTAKSIPIKRKPTRESPIALQTTRTLRLAVEVVLRKALKPPAALVLPREAPAAPLAKA